MFIEGTQRLSIVHLIVENDLAAVQFWMSGLTPARCDYNNQYAFFFRIDGDRIAEIWENIDTAYVYRKHGIEPTWVSRGGN
jgi:ketosteroid isomerase-like protein